MDNSSRSERTRKATIQAALAIIARGGPRRLTLDAIAKESGISKGGLMHQFPTKQAVLKALLEYQIEHFDVFSRQYLAEHGSKKPYPCLATQIATTREAIARPDAVAFAILAALAEEPDLLSITKEIDIKNVAAIKAEAADPELAILRWIAARGLLLISLLGGSPFSETERERLYDLLLDDRQWTPLVRAKAHRGRTPARRKAKPR
jgi:AcrR family transcriptional regulator